MKAFFKRSTILLPCFCGLVALVLIGITLSVLIKWNPSEDHLKAPSQPLVKYNLPQATQPSAALQQPAPKISLAPHAVRQPLPKNKQESLHQRYYADAPIISSDTYPLRQAGYQKRVTLLETTLKYPRIRIEDTLLNKGPDNEAEVVHSIAMAATHLVIELSQEQATREATLAKLNLLGYALRHEAAFSDTVLIAVSENAFDESLTALQEMLGEEAIVEPDYIVFPSGLANDPSYQNGALWGLENTGQSGGTPGADISAADAWDLRTDASSVIVGIVDTGIRTTHQDLVGNLWSNSGEIAGNGLDDDGNGVIDDLHGFDAIENSGNPQDNDGHGTHVAGTVGAQGNNSTGVTGVAWDVQLMGLRFLSSNGGFTSDAIEAIDYGRLNGATVLNNSWGGGGSSNALFNAISRAQSAGILFVVAAGNDNTNNDTAPSYPASYNLDNIISVASSDRSDNRSSFSNFGASSVDLAAPGSSIRSTYHLNDASYASLSGTSMASPHVAGAGAILMAAFPSESVAQIKARLLDTVDPLPAFASNTVSGGRLNLFAALRNEAAPQPGVITFSELSAQVVETAGEVAVIVNRAVGSSGSVSIHYSTVNGGATGGQDYTADNSGTLSWTDGDNSERIINIALTDDDQSEGIETFFIQLSNPSGGATLGTANRIEITILDDEATILKGLGFDNTVAIHSSAFALSSPSPALATAEDDSYALVEIEFDSVGRVQLRLRRYNANGTLAWERTHTAQQGVFQPRIAFGNDGGIAVAYARIVSISQGFIQQTDIAVAYYDTNGNLLWDSVLEGDSASIDLANSVAVDDDGSIYVAGQYDLSNTVDTYLAKVSSSGAFQWLDTHNFGSTPVDDAINSIDIDSQGTIYAGAWSVGSNGFVGAFMKYLPDGTRALAQTFPAQEQQRVLSVAINTFDEVYLGIRTFNNSTGIFNGKLLKLSPIDGSIIWQRAESIGDSIPNFIITANPNGFINFAEAPISIAQATSDYSIGQYDRDGNKVFENALDANAPIALTAIGGLSDGSILLSGSFEGVAQFGANILNSGTEPSLFISKLSPQDPLAPGTFHFETANYSVLEDTGYIDVIVRRVDGFDGSVTLTLNSINGDATAHEDYTAVVDHNITFSPGQQTEPCRVQLNDDFIVEPNESFLLTLSAPTHGATLGTESTTVTILNDDSAYKSWLREFFSEEELNDPTLSDAQADPEHDGLSNLLEYALGLDPKRINTAPEFTVIASTQESVTLRYERARDREDLEFKVESSALLESWDYVTPLQTSVTVKSDTQESVTVEIPQALTLGLSHFFRLSVESAGEGIGAL